MIKAGGAGSIPDSVAYTKPPASQPLAHLLRQLGEVTFSLNTAVVGLDAVENGYPKPDKLDISWNPVDVRLAARKSRKFILDAVIVRSAEAIGAYVDALAQLPRNGAVRARWGNEDISKADRAQGILTNIAGSKNFLVSSALLIVHWRNRIIHSKSRASLSAKEKALLIENEELISSQYKNLSIVGTLAHFEADRATLKDISSLISMTINLARQVDIAINEASSKEDLDALLIHYGLTSMITKVHAETAPPKQNASIERLIKREAPGLFQSYKRYYL